MIENWCGHVLYNLNNKVELSMSQDAREIFMAIHTVSIKTVQDLAKEQL